ncbi:poly(ADP-ribose) glycohydrolase isoform X2 [Macrosteles quadrilineatus]|uniref:poly(ADP-ribose) glycohydrolase isoform X2 n=1 Tax=Macrosteles quadrilineatus TaxID=74068 RepID=UPI0023E1C2C1|nr:poly(ADP-ribose) glycohydrolase isoform X2 [Macrosteles quadrilineatus]
MPHSPSSLYPVTPTELRTRWELVEESLRTTINNSDQLQAAVLHYNSKYSDRWDFHLMHSFFSQALEEEETEYFFKIVLPKIIKLALSLPKVVTGGVPLLRQHHTHSISLSQYQVSCLLANAFLCTFPRRNTTKNNSEYSSFPYINFNRLFNGDFAKDARIPCLHEKLKCLINYFRRVTSKVPDGVVTFSRHHVSSGELPEWSSLSVKLPNLYISSEGTIEDQGYGMLQMDFANKMVGGGVLGRGCVQEEIRFAICPELILARLFAEVLTDTEALIINGCERFSMYKGYSDNFEWAGNFEDQTPRDSFGRRYCTVVAVDATRFPNPKVQYSANNINRELNKAYAGFSWGMKSDGHEAVATGNWGCGAFNGDACLKSLLQLMAAGVAGRDVAYFTFSNKELRDQVANMHNFLTQHQITVGCLWKILTCYSPLQHRHSLYGHIYKTVSGDPSMEISFHHP